MMQFGTSENDAGVGGLAVRPTPEAVGRLSTTFGKRPHETLGNSGIENSNPGECSRRQVSLDSTGKEPKSNEASRMNDRNDENSYRGLW